MNNISQYLQEFLTSKNPEDVKLAESSLKVLLASSPEGSQLQKDLQGLLDYVQGASPIPPNVLMQRLKTITQDSADQPISSASVFNTLKTLLKNNDTATALEGFALFEGSFRERNTR